jgi:hypothetical protein
MRPAGHKGECCIEPHAEDIHMSKNGNVVIAAEPEVKDAK